MIDGLFELLYLNRIEQLVFNGFKVWDLIATAFSPVMMNGKLRISTKSTSSIESID
jgi:hypothetical protein